MKTDFFKWFLRGWIAVVSAAAFVTGWLFLGHAAKPVSTVDAAVGPQPQLTPLPTLVPLTSDNRSGSTLQPFSQRAVPQFSQPMFRSRGS